MEDLICIDDKYYDPYFILQVSKKDVKKKEFKKTLIKNYKKYILKYHPDKCKDKSNKFLIIQKSYDYILENIRYAQTNTTHSVFNASKELEEDFKDINNDKNIEIKKAYEKIKPKKEENIEINSYANALVDTSIKTVNQFAKRKFTNEEFNKIFEYVKEKNNEKTIIVEETIDGFNGYNQDTLFPSVSSFNGLMITQDNIYENGYDEVSILFNNSKNPQNIITKDEYNKKKKLEICKKNDYRGEYSPGNYKQEEKKLYDTIYNKLKKKEEDDKNKILKNASKFYDSVYIEDCINNKLESSTTFLSQFDKHFYSKRIN